MNEKDLRKAAREHRIFGQFCQTARIQLKPGSIESRKPPEPDVRCVILEQTYYAELVEITDEGLARNLNQSLKTGEITGGFFSQVVPLSKALEEKSANLYATSGSPMFLLAYYDKQYPWDYDPNFLPEAIGHVARRMVGCGAWHSVWVYDTWKSRVLWSHGRHF